MANKRTLKKGINLICEELFAEAVAASLYGHDVNEENANALLHTIVTMEDDFLARVSHPEPGMPPRTYYNKLKDDFNERVSEILDQINS